MKINSLYFFNILIFTPIFLGIILYLLHCIRFLHISTKFFNFLFYLFIIFYSLVIGIRDYNIGADTIIYLNPNFASDQLLIEKSPLFALIHSFLFTLFGDDYIILIFSLITHFILFLVIKKLFITDYFIIFIFFFLSLSYVPYTTNIIRQGICIYLSFYFLFNAKINILYRIMGLFICFFIHKVVLVLYFSYFLSFFLSNRISRLIIFFISCFVFYFKSQIYSKIIQIGLLDISSYDYLVSQFNVKIGLRIDFIIFNFILVLIWWYAVYNENKNRRNIFHSFVIISFIFVFAMDVPYSDRIGNISWSLIPFMLNDLRKSQSRFAIILFPFSILILYAFNLYLIGKHSFSFD